MLMLIRLRMIMLSMTFSSLFSTQVTRQFKVVKHFLTETLFAVTVECNCWLKNQPWLVSVTGSVSVSAIPLRKKIF